MDEDDPALFVSDVVDKLDLSAIRDSYGVNLRGQPPYDPRMMVKILVWGYCQGIRSSRKIARSLSRDVSFRLLAAGNFPDFRTIAAFRRRHLDALSGLFDQILGLCAAAGLVKLGHVALDGTKMKANASKHKAMSYGRMKKEQKRLREEISRMLEDAEQTDRDEDDRHGPSDRGDGLPEELRRREDRLRKIEEAKARLEERAKERDRSKLEAAAEREAAGKKPRKRKYPLGVPREKEQENFTDPESRIMKAGGDFVQGYNAQAAVDAEAQVIVVSDVTSQASDAGLASRLVRQIPEALDRNPNVISADAGYFSNDEIRSLEEQDVDPHVSVARQRRSRAVTPARRGRIPKSATVRERMERKLRTKRGREIYARRKAIVEPVFGQIKEAKGIRTFLLRGLENVRREWSLICAGHNLMKLANARRKAGFS